MIDRRLFEATKAALKVGTDQAVYGRIARLRRKWGHLLTREQAAHLLASESGVDVSRFLSREEVTEVLSIRAKRPPEEEVRRQAVVTSRENAKRGRAERGGAAAGIRDPCLPPRRIGEADRMSSVYKTLYFFENSIRYFIIGVLKNALGNNWWSKVASRKLREKVTDRMRQEAANRWHPARGAHPIFYTDTGDLTNILNAQWQRFRNFFPTQAWIRSRLEEIEVCRNIVAHHNPLDKRNRDKIGMYYSEWCDQLSGI